MDPGCGFVHTMNSPSCSCAACKHVCVQSKGEKRPSSRHFVELLDPSISSEL